MSLGFYDFRTNWLVFICLPGLLFATGSACKDKKQKPTNAKFELEANQAKVLGNNISSLPDGGLVDQENQRFSFESLKGYTTVIGFIYTECPRSRECPLLVQKLKTVRDRLSETGEDDFRIIMVTIDPTRDTPEKLREFADRKGLNSDHTVWVTGRSSTLNELAKKFGIAAETNPLDGSIDHNVRTYLVDQQGRIVYGLETSRWESEGLASLALTNIKK